MESQLIAGVYFFFLLVGITFGMLVGYVIGYKSAVIEYLDAEDDDDDFDASGEFFYSQEDRYDGR